MVTVEYHEIEMKFDFVLFIQHFGGYVKVCGDRIILIQEHFTGLRVDADL